MIPPKSHLLFCSISLVTLQCLLWGNVNVKGKGKERNMHQDYQIMKFVMIFGLGNQDLTLHIAPGHKVIVIMKSLIHTVTKEKLRRLKPQAKIRL